MTLRERILKRVADFVYNQYPFILVIAILLTIASLGYTALFLKTKTGRIDLISDTNPACKRFLHFLDNFGSPDNLVMLIQGGDAAAREKAAELLAEKLSRERDVVQKVFYRIPVEFFEKRGLQYADVETLKQVALSLKNFSSTLNETEGRMDLLSLFRLIEAKLKQSFAEQRDLTDEEKKNFLWIAHFLENMEKGLSRPEAGFDLSFLEENPAAKKEDPLLKSHGFFTSNSQQLYFVFVKPTETKNDFKFVKRFLTRVDKITSEVKKGMPQIEIGLTGVPSIIYEEMMTTTWDVNQASIISFVGILLLFTFSFRAFRKPMMVATVMFMGICFTFAFATLAVGSLNLMSMVFASMLLGSGNGFGVHILMRYREERLKGHNPKEAVESVVAYTGQGILCVAITTAAVFYSLIFSEFKGFSEFGVISGTGVLLCFAAMIIVVPAFLVLWEKSGKGHPYYEKKRTKTHAQLKMPHVAKILHFPKTVIVLCLALTAYLAMWGREVGYNGSLLDIQAKNSVSFANEQKMMKDSSLSPRFAAVLANSPEEMKQKVALLKKLPAVGKVESILSAIPDITPEKKALLDQIAAAAEKITIAPALEPVDARALKKVMTGIEKKLAMAESYVKSHHIEDKAQLLLDFKKRVDGVLDAWEKVDPQEAAQRLEAFQKAYLLLLRRNMSRLKKMTQEPLVTINELPEDIRDRFVGKDGQLLIYVFPKKSVWGDAELYGFTQQVMRVDPEATGTPFLVREVTEMMERGGLKSAWLAFVSVLLLMLIHFRRPLPVLFALAPLVMGIVWMIGIMGLLDVQFNPANVIALPLVIGIALDNGVHMVNRFFEKGGVHLEGVMKVTSKAVYLNSITTIVCFGALMVANHRGIASLGLVLVLGMTSCLLTSVIFLPALFKLTYHYYHKKSVS